MARVHWLICGRFGGKLTLPGGYSKIGGAKTVRTRFPHHRRLGAHLWSGVTRVLQVPPPPQGMQIASPSQSCHFINGQWNRYIARVAARASNMPLHYHRNACPRFHTKAFRLRDSLTFCNFLSE
jgi:hypothetical protein